MRIVLTILMVFIGLIVWLTTTIEPLSPKTNDRLTPLVPTTGTRETPLPDSSHYVNQDIGLELDYPQWYNTKALHQGTLQDRLQLLPAQDRNRDRYLVVSRLGMIVPVLSLSSDVSFFGIQSQRALQDGAVLHPSGSGQAHIIGGHTSTLSRDPGRYRTIFQSLVLLQTGDTIRLYKKESSDRWGYEDYTFSSREVVSPQDTDTLTTASPDMLILYGCYPFGSDAKRVVVKTKRS